MISKEKVKRTNLTFSQKVLLMVKEININLQSKQQNVEIMEYFYSIEGRAVITAIHDKRLSHGKCLILTHVIHVT